MRSASSSLPTVFYFAATRVLVTKFFLTRTRHKSRQPGKVSGKELFMKRNLKTILTGAFLVASTMHADSGHFTEGKQAFTSIKNNLIQMAESMPEANYS